MTAIAPARSSIGPSRDSNGERQPSPGKRSQGHALIRRGVDARQLAMIRSAGVSGDAPSIIASVRVPPMPHAAILDHPQSRATAVVGPSRVDAGPSSCRASSGPSDPGHRSPAFAG